MLPSRKLQQWYTHRVSVGQWVIEFRDNNWIYITDKGWVEFDEKLFVGFDRFVKKKSRSLWSDSSLFY